MSDVFCNNCGHRNPSGSNFCSSCGAVLEIDQPDNRTITFHPTSPSDPIDEELTVDLDQTVRDVAVLVIKRGPDAGLRFPLDKDTVKVGRHPDSDIFLDDITVSRRHADIVRDGPGFTVTDSGSLNGTYLNRERIEAAELHNSDELQIGKFKLVFLTGSDEGRTGAGA